MNAIVQCTFVSDTNLSKHLHTQVKGNNYGNNVIDTVCGSYFGVYGSI